MSRLVGLYPRRWRDRYELEFREVLAARPPSLVGRIDIIQGALEEHLRPVVPGPERVRDLYGIGPLVGFVLLITAAMIMANGPIHHDEYGTYRDGALGLPLLIGGMVFLAVGIHRVVDRLPKDAFAARSAGWTAIVLGLIWAMMPWVFAIGFGFMLGVLGLAVGARRSGIWPAWSEIVLTGALVVPAGLLLAAQFLPWYAFRVVELDFSIVMIPASAIWLVVGGLLLRGAPRPTPA